MTNENPEVQQPADEPALPSWERLEELGIGLALVQSIREILFEPTATFRRMPKTGGLGKPLIFLLLIATPSMMVVAFYGLVRAALVPDSTGLLARILGGMGIDLPSVIRSAPVLSICMVVMAPILYTISSFVLSGLVHLMLMLLNGNRYSYETTYRTIAYVLGATAVLNVVPYCGAFLLAPIWGLAGSILALIATQETVPAKAAAAVVTPLCVCCFCLATPAAILYFLVALFTET